MGKVSEMKFLKTRTLYSYSGNNNFYVGIDNFNLNLNAVAYYYPCEGDNNEDKTRVLIIGTPEATIIEVPYTEFDKLIKTGYTETSKILYEKK